MRSPLASGILYIFLGIVFTYLAIQQVIVKDWNFIAYLLIIIATFDLGAGFRLLFLHFKRKDKK
ncbi:YdiK family protein [Bacillus sp. FJAT-50079]|uniref:YdiK family protein n=1 Tax=Bacillus sp. FJAT-50079 TaxID=2833577 RepID=UPI001BC9E1CA|nr:YdiK family protein [Bacillus sp. FJAT-50079]MBS4210437.1 YdiK family protein [Bacillus sp. FJAT-50079]